MPWCENCDRFYNPNSVAPDGTCVRCGADIAEEPTPEQAARATRIPWHFWILLVALVVYLGWRAFQGVEWLAQHL